MISNKTFRNMTDAEIEEATRHIVQTSMSENEVKRRLVDEIGYPYGIAICVSEIPMTAESVEAQQIVRGLGGLTLKTGAMVMIMMHGHDGTIQF